MLGNTPAVARSSYVDPRVIERYENGDTVGDALADADVDSVVETVLVNGNGRSDGSDGGDHDDEVGTLDAVPRKLLAEVDAASSTSSSARLGVRPGAAGVPDRRSGLYACRQ